MNLKISINTKVLHLPFEVTSDGNEGIKLFIIVYASRDFCLVCKATSKENKYRIKKPGCSAPDKNYYMLLGNHDFFSSDTWIQFDELYSFTLEDLLKDKFGGQAEYKKNTKNTNN